MSHNVSECPALEKLHDNPQLVSHQVAVVHVNYVLMMVVPHDHHLKHRDRQTEGNYFDYIFTYYISLDMICFYWDGS